MVSIFVKRGLKKCYPTASIYYYFTLGGGEIRVKPSGKLTRGRISAVGCEHLPAKTLSSLVWFYSLCCKYLIILSN